MTGRMDAEALRALVDATDPCVFCDGRGHEMCGYADAECTCGSETEDCKFCDGKGAVVSSAATLKLEKASRALAAEVLELRAALTRISRTIIVSECQQIAREALGE
ncbi:hypothetical protein [Pseudogemmobacter faecipullorum]|uniref:Uncharacterized protein n=1 Tax=Pseudogemmobacter faecipullorum TaxID=2755041 RepID=A0ABS8CR28_9RHOB|nr:hypothetical protein [Pseudogemmobacter faecipullorum]MCB5411824.1 hypothetical protein [Pseudogemmobacter faecipullorum]